MKKLVFLLFVVSFSAPVLAQMPDVPSEFRSAKQELIVSNTRIENIEITPASGVQPEELNSQIVFTFTYVDGQLKEVSSNSMDLNIKCSEPQKATNNNYYVAWWCYRDNYNIFWGCDEKDKNYVIAKAPR